ncbi:MAG TPA: cytidine deaminase [Bacilli bacterium]|nr:cytidine deaminase [Bacilli bacterium]
MDKQKLIKEAIKAMDNAYVPYSKFKVGAALLTKDGTIYHGANIENAAYGLAMCGERNAIYNAYNHGVKKDDIVALAIIGNTAKPISPCGSCRQVISELLPKEALIILTNMKGDILEVNKEDLLPFAFDDSDL